MDNGYILGPQHLVDGILLSLVQVREAHRREAECLCRLVRIEQIPQIAQTSFRPDDTVESLKHHLIASLVEKELNAYVLRPLHVDKLAVVRHSHHHTVTVNITHSGSEVKVFDLLSTRDAEETHRPPELEIVFYLLVTLTKHLYHQLVQ